MTRPFALALALAASARAFARIPPRPGPAPRWRSRLRPTVAAVALACVGAAVPLAAPAATVTIDDHVIVIFGSSPWVNRPNPGDTLVITPTGFLDAPAQSTGTAFNLTPYTVENAGRIRAFFGTENNGLFFGGLNNINTGRIEAGTFGLVGGQLNNDGLLITGAATRPDGVLVTSGSGDAFGSIDAGSRLESSGTLRNYGGFDVIGTLENTGTLEQKFLPAVGSANSRTLKVGSFVDGTVSRFDNFGTATFEGGTRLWVDAFFFNGTPRLVNSAVIQNNGNIVLQPGAWLQMTQFGEFRNGINGVVDVGGSVPIAVGEPAAQVLVSGFGVYANDPGGRTIVRSRAVFDATQFDSATGTVRNRGVFDVLGTLKNEEFYNDGNLAVEGLFTGGSLYEGGSTRVRGGGMMDVEFASVAPGGRLTVESGGEFAGILFSSADTGVVVEGTARIRGGTLGDFFFTPGSPTVEVFQVRAGGQAFLNSFATLELLQGSTASNAGTLRLQAGSALRVESRFTNSGQMTVENTAVVDLRPPMSEGRFVNAAGGSVTLEGRFIGAAAFPGETGGVIENAGSFSIAATGVVGPGGAGESGPLGRFEQVDGTLAIASGGQLNTDLLTMTGGTLMGSGQINGSVFIAGGGPVDPAVSCATPQAGIACFKPGFSPGSMVIGGDLTMGAGSVLELEIELVGGVLAWDRVTAGTMSFVDGAIIRLFVAPGIDLQQPLALLACTGGGCDFSGAQFQFAGDASGQWFASASGLSVVAMAPIPEPGAAAMLALGLAVLGWRRRAALRAPAAR